MEKYNNRRVMVRQGGKFAKAPTLEQQGYAINTSRQMCTNCKHEWMPILATGKCPKCDEQLKTE